MRNLKLILNLKAAGDGQPSPYLLEVDNLINLNEIKESLINREIKAIGKHKYFSVLVPIVETEEGLSFLFEVRASKLRTQPGDICFPGGNIEAGETALECALRETKEEIGIELSESNILGQFDTMYGFSGYSLFTHVATIGKDEITKLSINEEEVEEVFTVPIQFFIDNPAKNYDLDVVSKTEDFPYEETGISPDYKWRVGKNVLPFYRYEDKKIWGVTARIVDWFVKELL